MDVEVDVEVWEEIGRAHERGAEQQAVELGKVDHEPQPLDAQLQATILRAAESAGAEVECGRRAGRVTRRPRTGATHDSAQKTHWRHALKCREHTLASAGHTHWRPGARSRAAARFSRRM
eukprot:6297163-Prymnesium_polylepis.1